MFPVVRTWGNNGLSQNDLSQNGYGSTPLYINGVYKQIIPLPCLGPSGPRLGGGNTSQSLAGLGEGSLDEGPAPVRGQTWRAVQANETLADFSI